MRIIGCDFHASQQSIAMLDCETGEINRQTLKHDGETVRAFYRALPTPVTVGIEATGSMGWFLQMLDELGITYQVGHPAKIRQADTRKQKHDRRDAVLLLQLLVEQRFPAIWLPTNDQRDVRALLLHRHQWVRLRTRVQNALQAIALGQGVRRRASLWTRDGQSAMAAWCLPPHAGHRRDELQALYRHLNSQIDDLDERVAAQANQRPRATLLMTHPGVGPVTALATEVFLGDPFRFADGKALARYDIVGDALMLLGRTAEGSGNPAARDCYQTASEHLDTWVGDPVNAAKYRSHRAHRSLAVPAKPRTG